MDHSLSKECRFRCVVTAIVKCKRLETSSRGVYCSPEATLLGPGSFRAISDHQCFAKCGSSTPPSAKMGMLAPSLTVLWLQCVPAQTFPSHTNGMQQAVKCSRNQSQNPWHNLQMSHLPCKASWNCEAICRNTWACYGP